jgi:hypothetical protein
MFDPAQPQETIIEQFTKQDFNTCREQPHVNYEETLMPLARWFCRRQPKSRLGKFLRGLERAIVALLLLYAGLHAFPQVLFAHSVSGEGITIYSRDPLPPETTQRIAEIAALVARSELAVPGRQEKIFLCNSPWVFRLFCPRSTGAFGAAISVTDHVFVPQADLASNVAKRSAPSYNARAFSPLVAHEITHGLIRKRLGLIRAFRLPDWVDEGYCEYVAGEGSFPDDEGLPLLAAGEKLPSSAFRYFLYRQMVTYLIDDRGLSFQQVVDRAHEASGVEAELVAALRSRNAD